MKNEIIPAGKKITKRICVMGDLTMDWFHYDEFVTGNNNFHNYQAIHFALKPGGTFNLCSFLEDLFREEASEITGPRKVPGPYADSETNGLIRSHCHLKEYREKENDGRNAGSKKPLYRIDKYLGYNKVTDQAFQKYYGHITSEEVSKADLIVLDDANNEFRNWEGLRRLFGVIENDYRHKNRSSDSERITGPVIYKYGCPLPDPDGQPDNLLWNMIGKIMDRDDNYVIIHADDLRRTPKVQISKAYSWERTAKEVLFALFRNKSLEPLRNIGNLIVLFDLEGALIVENKKQRRSATLVFHPEYLESQRNNSIEGNTVGKTNLFVAILAKALAVNHRITCDDLKMGLECIYEYEKAGYGIAKTIIEESGSRKERPEIISNFSLSKLAGYDHFSDVNVPFPESLDDADPWYWRIVDEKMKYTYLNVAEDLAVEGIKAIGGIPRLKVGRFVSFDRREMEQMGAIRHLLEEYLMVEKTKQPLSFAVFGPPGSGKTFAVEQIAESFQPMPFVFLTFNISEFTGEHDLASAFQQVRDISLKGKIPFVFFDEFDTDNLLWLKHFLAPMQDNEFRQGELTHPLGTKSVFIFAGGTKPRFEQFDKCGDHDEDFILKKGPDFVSRLKGFINVTGINRQVIERNGGTFRDQDQYYLLRRALMLHTALEQGQTTKGLMSEKKYNLDPAVLRALLFIPEFKHGVRSLKSLLMMSRLSGKKVFSKSCLPSKEQLNMHVDAGQFLFLLGQERFASVAPELMFLSGYKNIIDLEKDLCGQFAAQIKKMYGKYEEVKQRDGSVVFRMNSDDLMRFVAASGLEEHFRKSTDDAASDVPAKMKKLNLGIIPVEFRRGLSDMTTEEAAELALSEHNRWINERIIQGWEYHEESNRFLKQNKNIVPFQDLHPVEKEKEFEQIYGILSLFPELECGGKSLEVCLFRKEESENRINIINLAVEILKILKSEEFSGIKDSLLPHPEITEVSKYHFTLERSAGSEGAYSRNTGEKFEAQISKLRENLDFIIHLIWSILLWKARLKKRMKERNHPDFHEGLLARFIYDCYINIQVMKGNYISVLKFREGEEFVNTWDFLQEADGTHENPVHKGMKENFGKFAGELIRLLKEVNGKEW